MGRPLRTLLSRFDRRPVDPEERSPQLGLKYKDLMLLDAIKSQGGDIFARDTSSTTCTSPPLKRR